MTERKPHVEKCCSRCGQINWDSENGGYNETCTVDGEKCDTSGIKTVDGVIQ